MSALVGLYTWAILAGVLGAAVLGLLGCWLAAQDRGMQTLCLGQGATLGVLLGLGILPTVGVEGEPGHFFPFLVAIVVSALTYGLSERMIRGRLASKNTFYAFLFAVLLAGTYLMGALFPTLESHMAQVFFGDLATLTNHDAYKAIGLAVVGMGVLLYRWRAFSNQAFESAIFGVGRREPFRRGRLLFRGVSFVAICFSVQYLGFLFTIACLFVPTSLVSFVGGRGLKRHLALASALAAVATLGGFVTSLQLTRMPTVPTIVGWMVALAPLVWILPGGREPRGSQVIQGT